RQAHSQHRRGEGTALARRQGTGEGGLNGSVVTAESRRMNSGDSTGMIETTATSVENGAQATMPPAHSSAPAPALPPAIPPLPKPPAIQTINLTKRYGALMALDTLNLTLESGDVFGFIGPNGAGKSTTMKIL